VSILKASLSRRLLSVLSQSVIDTAFDAQLTINLMAEFEKALKNYTLRTVTLNIKWKEFPEVKQCLKDEMLPDTHILTWCEKWVVDMGPVLKTHLIEKDLDHALFRYIPIMVTTSKGSIGALLSAEASFCERMNRSANQIVTAGNTFFGDDLVDKTVVLRMNKNFMKFMNLNYLWILKQSFPTFGTVISVADNEQDDVEMDYE